MGKLGGNENSPLKLDKCLILIYHFFILIHGVIGNTTDSDSVVLGSNPSGSANKKRKMHMSWKYPEYDGFPKTISIFDTFNKNCPYLFEYGTDKYTFRSFGWHVNLTENINTLSDTYSIILIGPYTGGISEESVKRWINIEKIK